MELLGIKTAAAELGIAVTTLRFYAESGRVGQKVDGKWIFTRDDLERFRSIPRKPGRPSSKPKSKPVPPTDIKLNPLSTLALKQKRPSKTNQGKGIEKELDF